MKVAIGLQVEQREPSMDGGLGNAGVGSQVRTLQWVALAGELCHAVWSTWATRRSSWVRVRPERCWSWSPAMPWW